MTTAYWGSPPLIPDDLSGLTTLRKISLYRRQKKYVENLAVEPLDNNFEEQMAMLAHANCALQSIRAAITTPIRD